MIEYRHEVALFLKYMGARADRALTTLQPRQIEAFKERLASRVAPSTVNKAIKVLKAAFNGAVAKRQLEFNPAEHVEGVETAEPVRRPFTAQELSKLLNAAETDWRTMILVAFYTGLRLRDCANLTWQNVELHTGTINVVTEKTSRRQVLPIAEPLARHLNTLAGDNPTAPLCPNLYGKNSSWLSGQFHNVMVKAGLAQKRDHLSKGKGRASKRQKRETSFHSLRYNTTSALKSNGVSDSVAMDIVGHETAAVSRNYTRIDDAAKRAAINKLPDITQ
jgi:integrase